MLQILSAIPVIGQIITLITSVGTGVVYGVKWIAWKIGIKKTLSKKEKIQNAETPGDFTDLLNNR